MEDKELLELEEFTLEDIIREFSDHPYEEPKEEPQEEPAEEMTEEPAEEEVPVAAAEAPEETPEEEAEPAEEPEVQPEETPAEEPGEETAPEPQEEPDGETEEAPLSDTIRLDTSEVLKGVARNAEPVDEEENGLDGDTIRIDPDEILAAAAKAEAEAEQSPFTENWEPEYEQPMGNYVPPQPIAFPSRADHREMKRKLVIGPEKKYYELTEKGLGGLQVTMFFCLVVVLLSAASTIAYAQGMIPDSRLRLMIFGQFLAVLISALLGSFQLIQGVGDLFKGRFTLNTLLVVTFLACCTDGVFCLLQDRIPCCAAFSLEVLLSLWSSYNRRHAELGQMDVLRKANRLNGICAKRDAHEGKTVLLRMTGHVEDFMENYDRPSAPEKRQDLYALIALVCALGTGVATILLYDVYTGIQVTAVSLLAAVPATAFIATTRPFAILQRRLHRLGAVLCGYQGVRQLGGKVIFPLYNEDVFPQGTTRMNGVKFFGERPTDMVLAYAAALVGEDGGGLAPLFRQVLDSRNGRHYEAENLRRYDNGGIGGNVLDEPVLVGTLNFLKEMGVEIPGGIQVSQAVCVAIDGELCGIFAISYEKTRSATAGLSTLSSYRGLSPVVATDEFMLSESFLRGKFGIKSKRLQFPDAQTRNALRAIVPEEESTAALLTTVEGLAPMAYCVTGARALRSACNLGVVLHMIGGVIGMGVVLTLVILGAAQLLTPANMFLYQLAWMLPGFLVTEWTRSI